MSGIMLNMVARTLVAPVPVIGSAFGGGFFAGQISTAGNGIADYNLVIGPAASADTLKIWKNANSDTVGADSDFDGAANTANIVADGNSTVYPAAHFCNDLVIGGFSDWYMPSKNELEICYFNLKPTTTSNNTSRGTNANAVPARASNYTAGTPAQTSATDFQSTGAEDFALDYYWTSTQSAASKAWLQTFNDGGQDPDTPKNNTFHVRAIRKVAV